ncbi:hypothetical protein DITRI_Ditri14bG0066900 [Diplodiscus trichospermus]
MFSGYAQNGLPDEPLVGFESNIYIESVHGTASSSDFVEKHNMIAMDRKQYKISGTLITQQLENMAQLDPMLQSSDNLGSNNAPTKQIVRAGDSQTWSPSPYASSSARSHEVHDPADVHYHSKTLTVIAKVKEKARRWRQSFIKKRNTEGDNTTPCWGVRLEDDEDYEDEDPEYLGAPMYESELAPEGYKENARQNPRAVPVISERHVLASSVKPVSEQTNKEPALEETKGKKPAPDNATETVATQKIASKIEGLSVSAPTASETEKHATHKTSMHGAHDADKYATQETGNTFSPRENKWDKGVSVKEYIMNKFEPGEDEKALSQVISEAISPRRTPGDVGVIEKVRGAVNSLLWREEPAQSTIKQSETKSSPQIPNPTNAQAGNFLRNWHILAYLVLAVQESTLPLDSEIQIIYHIYIAKISFSNSRCSFKNDLLILCYNGRQSRKNTPNQLKDKL